MKKSIVLILTVVLITAVSVGFFAGCGMFESMSYDEIKTNLTNANYNITEMTAEQFVNSDLNKYPSISEGELDQVIYAVKGDDYIYVFFFISTDVASSNADFISAGNLYEGQSNEIIYLATKQARDDAGFKLFK